MLGNESFFELRFLEVSVDRGTYASSANVIFAIDAIAD
eukprot:SAG22_NODE_16501_length_324_cov_0.675556_1_plen_37_part_01